MRIQAVNFNDFYRSMRINRKDKPNASESVKLPQPLKVDTVSFSGKGSVRNAEELKALLPFKIPDFYSPIILLDSDTMNRISQSHVFSSNIGRIAKTLRPLTPSLFPVEYDFYNIIRESAKRSPKKTIRKVITELYPEHNRILVSQQLRIFDRLKDASSDFPAHLLERFNALMYISEQKIQGEPVFVPFSNKVFKYELNNIRKRILQSPTDEEYRAINKLTGIAGVLPEIPKEQRMKPGFDIWGYEDQQKKMIDSFLKALSNSALAEDEDLIKLATIAEQRIYNVPAFIRFNRKSFLLDLERITGKLKDKTLARYVDRTAAALPTSKQSLSAFIVKAEGRSSEQIGYDMLSGSLGSIDHLVASHNGGDDIISNYVLASAYMNSLKGHKSFAEFYRQNKNIAEYGQAQVDRLIELANYTKIFRKVKLKDSYIPRLARKVEELSNDPTLIFDTHELK